MNLSSHLAFGVFSAFVAHYLSQDVVGAALVLLFQIGLILDFAIKRAIRFEPLHTLAAMLATWVTTAAFAPAYHWFVLFGYGSHLFLDGFVPEGVRLFWPSGKLLAYPVRHSERTVQMASVIGILLMQMLLNM